MKSKKSSIIIFLMLFLLTTILISCGEKKVVDIVLENNTMYKEENVNLSDYKIKVLYDDGNFDEMSIQDVQISQNDVEKLNTLGNQSIVVVYKDYSKTLYFEVIKKDKDIVTDITFKNTVYQEKEIDLTDYDLTVTYQDNHTEEITLKDVSINETDILKLNIVGNQTIDISYKDFTKKISFNVIKKDIDIVTDITFKNVIYQEKEINLTDYKLIVTYQDNHIEEITLNDVLMNEEDILKLNIIGNQIIEISYKDFTKYLGFEVIKKDSEIVKDIKIDNQIYQEKEINLENYSLTIIYKDNHEALITLKDVLIIEEDIAKLNIIGNQSIKITYQDFTIQLNFEVIKRNDSEKYSFRLNEKMIEYQNGDMWVELVTIFDIASFSSENLNIKQIKFYNRHFIIIFEDNTTLDIGQINNIPEYIIAFDADGGILPNEENVIYALEDMKIVAPIPVKEGYVFKGWFIIDLDVEFTIDYPILEDMSLIAKWERAVNIDQIINIIPRHIVGNNLLPMTNGIIYSYQDSSYMPYDLKNNCFYKQPKLSYDPVVIIVDNLLEKKEIKINFGLLSKNEEIVNSTCSYDIWSGYSIISENNHYLLQNDCLELITPEMVDDNHLNERVFDSGTQASDVLYCNQTDDYVRLELAQVAYSKESLYSVIIFDCNGEFIESYKDESILKTITLEKNQYLWCPGNNTPVSFQSLSKAKLSKDQKLVGDSVSQSLIKEKLSIAKNAILEMYDNTIHENDVSLPMEYALSGVNLDWVSTNTLILDDLGVKGEFFGTRKVLFNVTLSYKGETERMNLTLNSVGKPYKDITNNVVCAYVYYGTGFNLTDEMLDTVDVIYFAFANVSTDHKVYLNTTATQALRTVINKAHDKGVRVVVSIGENSNLFSDAAFTKEARATFALSILEMLETWELDGVDIDWELPGYNSDRELAVDKPNYTLLIQEIYNTIKPVNDQYLLTAALPGGAYGYNRFELSKLVKYFDFLNLMTYDMQGNTSSCHHSALYPSELTTTKSSISESVEIYKQNGFPLNKLVIGAAFYGRYRMESSQGVGKNINYTNIKSQYLDKLSSSIKRMWDDVAKAPYITVNGVFTITYDDAQSIKCKCEYVASSGVRGIMYWDNGSDSTGDLVHALYESLSVMKK